MIDALELRYRWRGTAHDCIAVDALHVAAGRTLFLYGPSGRGKSTLLGLLAGVRLPRAGQWPCWARRGPSCRVRGAAPTAPTMWATSSSSSTCWRT